MKNKGFKKTGISKSTLYKSLRQMGRKYIKQPWKGKWSEEKPTTGYCYVVSEFLYYYVFKKHAEIYILRTDDHGVKGSHWFLKCDGKVIDLTADQFKKPIDYSLGKRRHFMTNTPSKRAKIL